jgi:hypothetical protein
VAYKVTVLCKQALPVGEYTDSLGRPTLKIPEHSIFLYFNRISSSILVGEDLKI